MTAYISILLAAIIALSCVPQTAAQSQRQWYDRTRWQLFKLYCEHYDQDLFKRVSDSIGQAIKLDNWPRYDWPPDTLIDPEPIELREINGELYFPARFRASTRDIDPVRQRGLLANPRLKHSSPPALVPLKNLPQICAFSWLHWLAPSNCAVYSLNDSLGQLWFGEAYDSAMAVYDAKAWYDKVSWDLYLAWGRQFDQSRYIQVKDSVKECGGLMPDDAVIGFAPDHTSGSSSPNLRHVRGTTLVSAEVRWNSYPEELRDLLGDRFPSFHSDQYLQRSRGLWFTFPIELLPDIAAIPSVTDIVSLKIRVSPN